MLILSAADIRQVTSMPAAIDAVADAFVQLSGGHATVPLRTAIEQTQLGSHTLVMPAYLARSQALGLKVVSVFPQNQTRHQLPSIHALIVLLDAETGQPLAAMDGRFLTALRTGAGSGAATRVLARPESQVLALFGAGAQAPHQAHAICAVRPIERIWLVNRSRARAAALQAALLADGIAAELRIADSAQAALAQADIVCCATSAPTPLFDDADLRPGTHINGIGAFTPHMAEVPAATVGRARVVVDQRAAAWAEAGDLIQAHHAGLLQDAQVAELGAVISGHAIGRADAQQITFFKSVGNAAQDLAVAQLVLAAAQQRGLGTEVAL